MVPGELYARLGYISMINIQINVKNDFFQLEF